MFDAYGRTEGNGSVSRRGFVFLAVATVVGAVLWPRRRSGAVSAPNHDPLPEEVDIVEFSDKGERLRKVHVATVVKTEEEWKKQLSPLAYEVTRHADTERAFSGEYWNAHDKGLYRCICCDTALFDSATKFES